MQATEIFPFTFYFASPGRFDKALATLWTDTAVPTSTRRRLGSLVRKFPTDVLARYRAGDLLGTPSEIVEQIKGFQATGTSHLGTEVMPAFGTQ